MGNKHHRQRAHKGTDLTTSIVLDGATSSYADGDGLQTVLSDLDDRAGGGGGGSAYLEDDSTTFASPGVKFKDGGNYLANEGQTNTDYMQVILEPGLLELFGQIDNDTLAYIDIIPGTGNGDGVDIEAWDETADAGGYMILDVPRWIDLYHQSAGGGNWAEVIVAGNTGTVEVYCENDIILWGDGDLDAKHMGGLFFLPQHAADPTGVAGGSYYNTTTGKARIYNGIAAAWQDLN